MGSVVDEAHTITAKAAIAVLSPNLSLKVSGLIFSISPLDLLLELLPGEVQVLPGGSIVGDPR